MSLALFIADPSAAKGVPLFSFRGMSFDAYVSEVYDGDTITVIANPLGGPFNKFKVRLAGIDLPEMKPKKADYPDEGKRQGIKQMAVGARDVLRGKILGKIVQLHCLDVPQEHNYGRLLASVHCAGTNICDEMLRDTCARVYGGEHRDIWEPL